MSINLENQKTIGHAEDCLYDVLNQLPENDTRRAQIEALLPIMSDLYHSFAYDVKQESEQKA